jgi:uncharacterized protein (DUF2267 family)
MSSKLFSVHRHRASQSNKNVAHVAQAVLSVMKRELGADALGHWRSLFDAELGQPLFCDMKTAKRATKSLMKPMHPRMLTPSAWTPSKPKLTALVLKAFLHGDDLLAYDGLPIILKPSVSLGTQRSLSKLVSKRAIDWLMAYRANVIRASCEATAEQISDGDRIHKVLSRTAADVLAYLHAMAISQLKEADAVVLELHTTDQRLVGMETKGSGIVFCPQGRILFEQVVAKTLAQGDPNHCEA